MQWQEAYDSVNRDYVASAAFCGKRIDSTHLLDRLPLNLGDGIRRTIDVVGVVSGANTYYLTSGGSQHVFKLISSASGFILASAPIAHSVS